MSGELRRARVSDVVAMQRVINRHAERGDMLPRALHELYEDIRDFFVIEEDGTIVGCAALHVNWANLAEVKSVVIDEQYQRRGYGRQLLDACIAEARELGIARLFCLTYRPDFFAALGFQEIDRNMLPRKVWSECIRCPKFTNCTEIAMARQILDEPAPAPVDPLTSLVAMPQRHGH